MEERVYIFGRRRRDILRYELRRLERALLQRVLMYDGDESLCDRYANFLRVKLMIVNSELHATNRLWFRYYIEQLQLDYKDVKDLLVHTSAIDSRGLNAAEPRSEDQVSGASEATSGLDSICAEELRQHAEANGNGASAGQH